MNFASRLKELREENNLERDDLANKFNLSYSAIAKYETGIRTPDDDTKKAFAKYFNVSLDYLMGASNTRNPYNDEPTLPESFSTPEEAIKFLLEQNVIMGFGGFDIDKLSDEEKVDFANELLGQLKLLSYKYKK